MPYNASLNALERWRGTLDLLKGEEVKLHSVDPHKLAYRLREAITAAKRFKVEPYNKLDYSFKVEGQFVVAKPREQLVVAAVRVTARFEAAVNEYDVVSAATKAKEGILEFPNFAGDVKAVQFWADGQGFTVKQSPYLILERNEKDERD